MVYVTPDDIRAALVDPDYPMGDEFTQSLIDRALAVIRLNGYDPDAAQPDAVRIVVSNMVKRVLKNPDGIRQESETTGPSSRSVTYAGAMPGEMYLTREDRDMLEGRRRRGGAFTIDPTPRGRVTGMGYLGPDGGWSISYVN